MERSSPNAEPDLQGFLEAAGNELAGAQASLAGESLPQRTLVLISDAELEIRAAVVQERGGRLSLQTISATEMRKGVIDPALTSVLKIRYVATVEAGVAAPPTRTPGEVVRDVARRSDLMRLRDILGELSINASFVVGPRRWLVTVHDPEGRLMRELVLPDESGME